MMCVRGRLTSQVERCGLASRAGRGLSGGLGLVACGCGVGAVAPGVPVPEYTELDENRCVWRVAASGYNRDPDVFFL